MTCAARRAFDQRRRIDRRATERHDCRDGVRSRRYRFDNTNAKSNALVERNATIKPLLRLAAIWLGGLLIAVSFQTSAFAGLPPFWDLEDLGATLPNPLYSDGLRINARGSIVGETIECDPFCNLVRGFYRPSSGSAFVFPPYADDRFTTVDDINDDDVVVAHSFNQAPFRQQTIIWDPIGGFRTSPDFGARLATSINNRGDLVGNPAFVWTESSGFVDLTAIGESAVDINDVGEVIGETTAGTVFIRSADGALTHVPELPDVTRMQPIAINSQGDVLGYAYAANQPCCNGFLWNRETGSQLLPFSPSLMNDLGQIVGVTTDTGTPVFWSAGTGLINLNDGHVNAPPGALLAFARDINNAGVIVGVASILGETHAIRLTPALVPEPSSLFQLGSALLVVIAFGAMNANGRLPRLGRAQNVRRRR